MRAVVYKPEDLIEAQTVSRSERLGDEASSDFLTLDVQDLRQDIYCFRKKAKKCAKKPRTSLPEDEGKDEDVVPSRNEFGGKKLKMLGLSDKFVEMRDRAFDEAYILLPPSYLYVQILGGGGNLSGCGRFGNGKYQSWSSCMVSYKLFLRNLTSRIIGRTLLGQRHLQENRSRRFRGHSIWKSFAQR